MIDAPERKRMSAAKQTYAVTARAFEAAGIERN
jgi:hypothetical protein